MKEIINEIKAVLNINLFTLNQTDVTIQSLLILVLIVFGFILISKIFNSKILSRLLKRFNLEEGIRFTFIKIAQYIIISVGVIIGFQFIGIDLTGLAVVLGFLSVGIGFGLQNITSNFISGIILLFERPVKVGDRVTVGETEGDVTNISIRATTVRALNNISIIVPNSEFISNRVINWTHEDKNIRVDLDVGVSYNSDLETVIKALKEVAEECPDVLEDPKPFVHLRSFGDSSWNMKLMVWIDNPKKYYAVVSELNCNIVYKFRLYNVEIPFPQRDLHIKSSGGN